MANKKKYYTLPDYKTITDDIEVYIKAWRDLAKPIEDKMGLTLSGYDPSFMFTKGSPQGQSQAITLPVWFVRALSNQLTESSNAPTTVEC